MAFSLYKCRRTSEAINKLESIQIKDEYKYLYYSGLLYMYAALEFRDEDRVAQIQEEVDYYMNCPFQVKLHTGFMMLLSNNTDHYKAGKIGEELDQYNACVETKCLLGFTNIMSAREDRDYLFKKAYEFLEQAYDMDKSSMLAHLGLLNYYKYTNNKSKALDMCNQMIATDDTFAPALIERAQINLLKNFFDDAEETLLNVLEKDGSNTLAKYILLFKMILNPSEGDDLEKYLADFFKQIKKMEIYNSKYIISMIKTLSRTCGRDKHVLDGCKTLLEESMKINSSAEVLVELGFLYFLSGEYDKCIPLFQKAIKLDETNMLAMYYTTLARVYQGGEENLMQVDEYLDFFNEMDEEGNRMYICWINACLWKLREPSGSKWFEYLNETLKLHIEGLAEVKLDLDVSYYSVLNVDFMNELVNLSISELGLVPYERSNQLFSKCINYSENILEKITEFLPCNKDAQLMLSLVHIHRHNNDKALKCLNNLEEYGQYAESSLLKAWTYIQLNQFKEANNELNMVVSLDFKVKESPLFVLVESILLEKEFKLDEAIDNLTKVYKELFAKKKKKKGSVEPATSDMRLKLTFEDKASITLYLIKYLSTKQRLKEAKQIMSDSITEFKGTSQEIRMLIANAELSISFGEIKQAINILKTIDKSSSIWVESQKKLAQIYLNHIKDRRLYKMCFLNILEEDRSLPNLVLVGDALMEICEPDEAIEYYQEAYDYSNNSKDRQLIRKIGKALIYNHDYSRAVEYYEESIKNNPEDAELRQDLAKLYLDIDQIQHANNVLEEALKLESHNTNQDGLYLKRMVVIYLGLARSFVFRLQSNYKNTAPENVVDHYNNCLSFQNRVLQAIKEDRPENVQEQRKIYADIALEYGMFANETLNKLDDAIKIFTEGIKVYPRNETLIINYAKLQMRAGNYPMVIKAITNILQIDPENVEAHKLQAQVYCLNNNVEKAIQVLTNSYKKNKETGLLEELLLTLYRYGHAEELHNIFNNFIVPNNKNHAMSYTCALYYRYTYKPQEALKHFNISRVTSKNKLKALCNMIDIYLHPEMDPILPDLSLSIDMDTINKNLKDAVNLLDEVKLIDEDELIYNLYKALILISGRNLKDGQAGMEILKEMKTNTKISSSKYLNTKLHYALLAGAMITRNKAEIGEYGKAVKALTFDSESVLDLSKAYLIMIRYSVDNQAIPSANDLCKKVMKMDASNIKALELTSELHENAGEINESIAMLEKAYTLTDKNTPWIGFKLATLHFKMKNYVNCLDICNNILLKYPD